MDYVIVLARKNLDIIDSQIENIPINNVDRDYLASIFNNKFDEKEYSNFINSDTYFYKLSWRENFKKYTQNGEKTFYDVYVNRYSECFDL